MPRVFGGLGKPFRKPRSNPQERRIKAAWGGLFFGYFLLATQKKVSRLPVREPVLNKGFAKAKQIKRKPQKVRGAYPTGLNRTAQSARSAKA